MKCYCSECGAEHNYSAAKPKFCSQCGKSMGFGVPTTAAKPVIQAEIIEDTTQTSPSMVQADIVDSGGPQRIKFEDVIKQGKTGFSRPAGVFTPEKAMAELRETAKTTRIEDTDT